MINIVLFERTLGIHSPYIGKVFGVLNMAYVRLYLLSTDVQVVKLFDSKSVIMWTLKLQVSDFTVYLNEHFSVLTSYIVDLTIFYLINKRRGRRTWES